MGGTVAAAAGAASRLSRLLLVAVVVGGWVTLPAVAWAGFTATTSNTESSWTTAPYPGGATYAAGDAKVGATGSVDLSPNHVPQPVGGVTTWSSVSNGTDHSCGIRADGTLWCWGQNI